jgi:hypothetical protein
LLPSQFDSVTVVSDGSNWRVIESNIVCMARYRISTNFTASTTTPVNYDTKIFDTHSVVTTSSTAWRFVAPFSDYYRVDITSYTTSGTTTNMAVYVAGSTGVSLSSVNNAFIGSGSVVINAAKGDSIDIRPGASVTMDASGTGLYNQVSITRLRM